MIEFLLTFLVFVAVVVVMSVGVMRGRKPISGSCGGLANLGIAGACEICGGDPSRCEKEDPEVLRAGSGATFYDASRR
jgi:hypothetical protein